MGLGDVGDIEMGSIVVCFDMHRIDDEDRERIYAMILHIDHLVRTKIKRKQQPKKAG